MLTLHGFSYSNYYNIPKHALLYKGVEFAEDLVYPSNEGYTHYNPVGKVPSLTLGDGQHLAEASVICEYIEEAYPEPALMPKDPYARGQVRQIMRYAELYLELSSRRLLPYFFSKQTPPAELADEVNAVLDRGVAGMNALCHIEPFLAGETFTMADIYIRYVLSVVDVAQAVLQRDVVGEIEGLGEWRARMDEDPVSQKVDADKAANQADFFAYVASR
ncbi:MAG: hypothetical protein Cons2KO_10680 [Congregibacter sp.]